MKRQTRLITLAVLALIAGSAAASPPDDLDAYIKEAMDAFDAPGLAVAIVEHGKTTVTKGYGVRKLGDPAPVDDQTLFPIASNTKQFTATALAMLVDEGKLSWDDKVVSHLPGFQMYDPYVTGEMTVVDLLTHRSGLGLGEGDLMLIPRTDFTRQEIVEHLRYLKPARSFRSGYDYDNVLYIAAGQLIGNVAGQSWEDFVRTRIFTPLGMQDSVVSFSGLKPGSNRGWPHARLDGPIRGIGHVATVAPAIPVIDASNSAGGINTSARDIAKWLTVQLAHGQLPTGQRLFSEEQSAALWNPETLMPIDRSEGAGALTSTRPQFQSYALGYEVLDYRGHKIVTHRGGWIGALSTTVLIPDRQIAFAVMINSEESGTLRAVELKLLDHYLDQPSTDWTPIIREFRKGKIDAALAFLEAHPAATAVGEPPSLPLDGYAGIYKDSWYGTVTIRRTSAGLSISFDRTPGMVGALEPLGHDTFRTRWTDHGIEDAYVSFTLKPGGTIDHFTMQAISPLADFSFDYQDLMLTPMKAD